MLEWLGFFFVCVVKLTILNSLLVFVLRELHSIQAVYLYMK